jgi:hypothetical protein
MGKFSSKSSTRDDPKATMDTGENAWRALSSLRVDARLGARLAGRGPLHHGRPTRGCTRALELDRNGVALRTLGLDADGQGCMADVVHLGPAGRSQAESPTVHRW